MIKHALEEGISLLRRRTGVSLVLAVCLAVPLSLSSFTASLGLWARPLMSLEEEMTVVRVLLHPKLTDRQRGDWIAEQAQLHPEWILSEVPEAELADRLRVWFPYLEDLLEGETSMELPPLVEVQAPEPDEVAIIAENPSVIAVGPRTSMNRMLGQGAALLAGLLAGLSLILLVSAFILAATWIHLEIYRHAEEISIMRLVGVTEGAIRGPFIVAAAVPGIVAAILAVSGTVFLIGIVAGAAERFGLLRPTVPLWLVAAEMIVGVGVPVGAGWITLVRHARSDEAG